MAISCFLLDPKIALPKQLKIKRRFYILIYKDFSTGLYTVYYNCQIQDKS